MTTLWMRTLLAPAMLAASFCALPASADAISDAAVAVHDACVDEMQALRPEIPADRDPNDVETAHRVAADAGQFQCMDFVLSFCAVTLEPAGCMSAASDRLLDRRVVTVAAMPEDLSEIGTNPLTNRRYMREREALLSPELDYECPEPPEGLEASCGLMAELYGQFRLRSLQRTLAIAQARER